jgi:hypothetical protein
VRQGPWRTVRQHALQALLGVQDGLRQRLCVVGAQQLRLGAVQVLLQARALAGFGGESMDAL